MNNHFHLLVETPRPNLTEGMHGLETRLAQAVNERQGGYGRVFQDRFGSKHVGTPAYLAHMFRYIALNPVHANVCARPGDWDWSGHRALASGAGAPLARVERVLDLLEEWGGARERRYTRLFDESGPCGPWSTAATPDPPRPSVAELVAIEGGVDAAMRSARWDFGYRLVEIAEALGLSVTTVSRRTHR